MKDSATRPRVTKPATRTLAIVMAGGSGSRLAPLTRWHAKPALPFGGQYRNIDFTLSNCVNSGIRRIAILTQYKAHSLIQHVCRGWGFLCPEVNEFVEVWPAQQRAGNGWYAGTADAIYQNLDLIVSHGADYVLVLAGDHIYKMDYLPMIQAHVDGGADLTVGCVEVPIEDACSFGVMGIGPNGWVQRFVEKPAAPQAVVPDTETALASMGIYVFDRERLTDCLRADAERAGSRHDFGFDVLPRLIDKGRVLAHVFRDDRNGVRAYWRDVGTLDQYWQANMELLADNPEMDLQDRSWPILTRAVQSAPPRFVAEGTAMRSIVSAGCWVAGRVEQSVLSVDCRVERNAIVEESVVLPNVEIGAGCRIRRAIIDSGCVIPSGTTIDGARSAGVGDQPISPKGVVLITAEVLGQKFGPRKATLQPTPVAAPEVQRGATVAQAAST